MAELQPTILYVDGDADHRHAMALLFRREGFQVQEAASGGEALRLVNERPDLVILDVRLPDMNGREVCRRIKTHPATTTIPVLHLSSVYVQTEDKAQALDNGADGYLLKTVEPREILAQVRALLRIQRAEEQARAAARQWQATFDALSEAVCLLDGGQRVIRCNRALAELLGLPLPEILGEPILDLFQRAFGASAVAKLTIVPALTQRARQELELANRCYRVTCDPVLNDEGQVVGSVWSLADVTEQRRLEEQLLQSQKFEAIGLLAGGVAHDFNNLLTAITGNITLLQGQLPENDPTQQVLQIINRAAWRAANLTRQLLGYSRQAVLWLQPVNCREAILETTALLRPLLEGQIDLQAQTAPDLWEVRADHGQLGQVLMNLCMNARDAMPHGGRLTLEAGNVALTAETAARPGEYVRVRVADTGHGMSAEMLPRIFDPFFTTKEVGQGVGLGLAVANGIVQQHEGWIECASEVGHGTRFDIYLPRFVNPQADAGTAGAVPPVTDQRPTILLVDDEPLIRELGRTVLRRSGHDILLAEDGIAAAHLVQMYLHQLDLVILDPTQSQHSSLEMLRQLHQARPRVPVLLVSGYPKEQELLDQIAAPVRFLAKPYRPEDLLDAVRGLLGAVQVEPARPPAEACYAI